MIVYRIQDAEGRGPYKPGLSHLWADEHGQYLPPFFEEFEKYKSRPTALWRVLRGSSCSGRGGR